MKRGFPDMMIRSPKPTLELDERLTMMVDGLVSQVACISKAAGELQQAMAGCKSMRQESMTPADLYDLHQITHVMEKALLAWSCDPKRPVDRGLDVWERATIVNMAVDSLAAVRRT